MSKTPESRRERCDDLLVQLALYGLDATEQLELDELIQQFDVSEDERFEQVIGVLDSAFDAKVNQADNLPDGFPVQLRDKIIQEASQYVGSTSSADACPEASVSATDLRRSHDSVSDSGWSTREIMLAFVTAASLLIAVASFSGSRGLKPVNRLDAPSIEAQLAQLRANRSGDLRVVPWSNPTNDAASIDAAGEIVWSDLEQRGFMVFDDLEVNDPTIQQYQLWIFDKARDDALPVDGGIFDIAERGRVIVPITAKLPITEATMFAVTIEQPGGVVQSKRERLPLLAKVIP
jgi:anti-sigma-K factor RskA